MWSGSIEFNGEEIRNRKPNVIVRRGLTQVTQGKDMYPAMTVEENLRIGAYTRNDKAGVVADMNKVFDYFPVLGERRRQLAATLSGGEVQMLVIGRGLMANPKLIMLDEPSSALAPRVVLDIFSIVNRINRNEGITILLVEQNVRMALLLAEYGYVIRDGVIHIEGDARDLINDDNVRLGLPRGHGRGRRGGAGPLRPAAAPTSENAWTCCSTSSSSDCPSASCTGWSRSASRSSSPGSTSSTSRTARCT